MKLFNKFFNRQKENRINTIPKITRIPINFIYRASSFVYYALMVSFIVSAVFRFLTGSSISWHVFNWTCPEFLKANIVFEVISILGLFSILPAWVYAKSDETMLKISYGDILRIVFPEHYFNSIAQVFWTLVCVAFSKIGHSESALIALIIVFVGLLQQWIVVYSIVLNKNICIKLSAYIWEQCTDKLFSDDKDREQQLYRGMICLAGNIPLRHDPYYQEYVKSFCILMCQAAEYEDPNSNNEHIHMRVQFLQPAVQYWSTNQCVIDNQYALGDIFQTLTLILTPKTCNNAKQCIQIITSAFIAGKLYYSCEKEDNFSMQSRYSELINQLNVCQRRLKTDVSIKASNNLNHDTADNILNYTPQVVLSMGWMLFQYRIIKWDKEWTSIPPSPKNTMQTDYIVATAEVMLENLLKKDTDNTNIFKYFCTIALTQTQLDEQDGELSR